ncbi:MAG: hypothetical protein K2J66_09075 [Muribaculaceae bacterium]|nr:hypothetical protein [Muribaculaceae bacterium]
MLAAVKKVLNDKASAGAVFEDDARNFILAPVDGGYNVYVAGESALTVTVYDIAGRAVAAVSTDGNTNRLFLSISLNREISTLNFITYKLSFYEKNNSIHTRQFISDSLQL